MNRKFICKSNFILRKILNKNENLEIIRDFIESILKIEIKEIYLNPYLKSKKKYLPKEENFGIADVRIKTIKNEELNVGIQIIDGYYIGNKMLLYYAQIHANQIEHDNTRNIVDTITINILDFIYFSGNEYHKIIKMEVPTESKEKIELHSLELPKFRLYVNNKEEKWIRYLKEGYYDLQDSDSEKIKKLDNLLNQYWENEKME